ncbi:hypothetical protein XH89_11185 [Bradyrhizobium sp. CCBAU 53340]|uniref:FkbM family methyltransferase n=1 Tax=Bradyrhizobium sp. CCBAU 53340 TaxID=1325112 RepID=UPI00188BF856|nr:FkbM family methyltransferase [Bradyrhizobium sp. CCBAU 53340]QOZ43987.1 hypothetical protein XH89_11185 [Bradyrhizobium sp. CCBAU 53340]
MGSASPTVSFLLGLPRSGTTLLAHLLQQHADLLAPPEPWLMLALERFGTVDRRHPADAFLVHSATEDFFARIDRAAAFRALGDAAYGQYLAAAGKCCFIDKTPRYWMILDFLKLLYPDAPRVILFRNPYAIAASLKRTWAVPVTPSDSAPAYAPYLADLILGLPILAARRDDPRTQVVYYEELVADPLREVRCVVSALGYDPAGITSTTLGSTDYLRSAKFGDRKILSTNTVDRHPIDEWKAQLTVEEMQAVTDMVGTELLFKLGYEREYEEVCRAGVIDRGEAVTQRHREVFQTWWDLRSNLKIAETTSISADVNDQYDPTPRVKAQGLSSTSLSIKEEAQLLIESDKEQALRLANAELEQRLATSEADRAARLDVIYQRDSLITELQNEMKRLEQVLATSDADRTARLQVINERDAVITRLRGEVRQLEQEVGSSETERRAGENVINEQEVTIAALKREVQRLGEVLARSEADRAQQLGLLREREIENLKLKGDVVRLEQVCSTLDGDRTGLSAAIHDRDTMITALKAEIAQEQTARAESITTQATIVGSRWWRLGRRFNVAPSIEIPAQKLRMFRSETPEVLAYHAASTARALEKISARGLNISTVIDVGASNGMWSAVARQFYPTASYFLIEAQKVHETDLINYCRVTPKTQYILAAAGDSVGEIYFDDSAPFGGVASHKLTESARTVLPVTTIDHEVSRRQLDGPFLVKLDTHGFEVPILQGAAETLKQANLVVIEVYNFKITDQSLLFDEMCAFMRTLGFGVIDISEPLWRQRDNSLWQFDLFFIPLSRVEFTTRTYT